MRTFTVLACLALSVGSSWATTTGEHTGSHFCYAEEACAPDTWPGVCHDGKRQSPIDLPLTVPTLGAKMYIDIGSYKGNAFRMQNNGHSISVDFVGASGHNEGSSSKNFSFPDPLKVVSPYTTMQGTREYKFSAVHFHWGVSDLDHGSEHCIAGKCHAFEIHFVHYLASYPSLADAVASGDESALTVLGVLVKVNPAKSAITALFKNTPLADSLECFAPIVRNLNKVQNADATSYTHVNEPLDFSKCISSSLEPWVYSYKGSLTTPGCNEQVNWFVMKETATTSHNDLNAFRTIVKDAEGAVLSENHRPTQPLNGRQVYMSKIAQYNGAVLSKMFG